ncbi:MAG: hypothetical protein V1697_03075, partial [Candidatus Levyibacteriota bacterium]
MERMRYEAQLRQNSTTTNRQKYGLICEKCGEVFTGTEENLRYENIICPYDKHTQGTQEALNRYVQFMQSKNLKQQNNDVMLGYKIYDDLDAAEKELGEFVKFKEFLGFEEIELFKLPPVG